MALLGLATAMSGCALSVEDQVHEASTLVHYAGSYDHVEGPDRNLLDRALAECPEKSVKAETACVRQGIDAAAPTLAALMALVPHCRAGAVCHYETTTRDRLGFVRANATDYVKRWRIDLDFRGTVGDAAHLPVTVVDRDDFDSPPSGPGGSG